MRLPLLRPLALSPPSSVQISCPLRRPVTAMASVKVQNPTEVEQGVQFVKQLEHQAMQAHDQAQELNKQGRFDEAQAKYAEMRRLDAAALDATQAMGCPSCREPAAAAAGDRSGEQTAESSVVYEQLHNPTAWPEAAPAGPLSMSQRAAGAIVGCCVCDAAATPVQWIYDVKLLEQLMDQRQQSAGASEGVVGLEFFDPVQSTFLPQYKTGRNSPYGEQTLLLLQSLAEQGGLHCSSYAELYAVFYRNGFDGYMNASTVAFLRNSSRGLKPPATGAEDQQADCVARLAPLVAMYCGDERLMSLVEAATRVTQNTAAAVAWACAGAAVLERLLQGQGAAAAVRATVQELQQRGGRMPDAQLAAAIAGHLTKALELQQQPHATAVQELGRNCHMPNALQTPLHAVLHQEWRLQQQQQQHQQQQQRQQQQQEGQPEPSLGSLSSQARQQLFVAAIRDALAAGGCCASRASYAGACLGALLGPDAVPGSWLEQYHAADKVQGWAQQICAARSS